MLTSSLGQNSADNGESITLSYGRAIGRGNFGTVVEAKMPVTGEIVAVKRVRQDVRIKNRELKMCKILSEWDHPNIVQLKYFFYTGGESEAEKTDIHLHLVFGFVPLNLSEIIAHFNDRNRKIPIQLVKLYSYQLARALLQLDAMHISHRDVKPANILVDPNSQQLRLCDFGSAKILAEGHSNTTYIGARYYRAPELVLEIEHYTTSVDCWSYACVLAEMLLGRALFQGKSSSDQLLEIITVLGTPTRRELHKIDASLGSLKFEKVNRMPLIKVFGVCGTAKSLDLIDKLLQWLPESRCTMLGVLTHSFFDELRAATLIIADMPTLPQLFNFTAAEISTNPELVRKLIPRHVQLNGTDAPTTAKIEQVNEHVQNDVLRHGFRNSVVPMLTIPKTRS